MEPFVIRATSGSEALIAPELGFNCYSFRAVLGAKTIDVLATAEGFAEGQGKPSHSGIPILFPFPNRIRGGKFHWNGEDYAIPQGLAAFDAGGNAIHGFCLDRPWRVVDNGPDFVTGEFQLSVDAPDRRDYWPTDFILRIRYSVLQTTLRADIDVINPDDQPLPWGFGTHAYFKMPLSDQSAPAHCLIEVPASEQWVLDSGCLPTGERIPVPKGKDLREGAYVTRMKLDDVYTALPDQREALHTLLLDEKAGLQVRQSCPEIFREVVCFTPPWMSAVCMEPYTCVTDAINLQQQGRDAGWETLEPGSTYSTWIEITAEPIIV